MAGTPPFASADGPSQAPPPPSPREERALLKLIGRTYLRSMGGAAQDPPPAEWDAQPFGIVRAAGGMLAALHFPRPSPRGLVLFGHPGIPPAKGYFHRNDRIPFVRELGFAAVTFDHGGFGESDAPTGLLHREWADVLAWARRRFPGLPLHVWGVSIGGYFAHHALARDEGVASAIFEQVTPNLLRYASDGRMRAAELLGRALAPSAVRWFAAESHAPHVRADHLLYISGTRDHGITNGEAERLSRAAGPFALHRAVEGARHLEAWKQGDARLREAVAATLGRA